MNENDNSISKIDRQFFLEFFVKVTTQIHIDKLMNDAFAQL